MLPEYKLGFSIISTIFCIICLTLFPKETRESLIFRNNDGFFGILTSIGTIAFFLGFIRVIVIIVNKING